MSISIIKPNSLGGLPAFTATAGTTSPAIGTNKITFSETLDTANCFASSTFTPTVAGLYLITLQVVTNMTSGVGAGAAIYKNGSSIAAQYASAAAAVNTPYSTSVLVQMNGTTDYVEAYAYFGSAGYSIISAGFQGVLVRAS